MNLIRKGRAIINAILFMSGFVAGHMNVNRIVILVASVLFGFFLLPLYNTPAQAILYFGLSTIFYVGLIFSVLPQNGLREKWKQKYGEEKAYRNFEALLAFAFLHNAYGMTHVSKCTSSMDLWNSMPHFYIYAIVILLFGGGLIVKIWSAIILGPSLYYWKDMFLGRPVSDFAVQGPYKYLSNPMYGAGQLQVYAIAIYYGSFYGLICCIINQALLFTFYYTAERPFINRVYLAKA